MMTRMSSILDRATAECSDDHAVARKDVGNRAVALNSGSDYAAVGNGDSDRATARYSGICGVDRASSGYSGGNRAGTDVEDAFPSASPPPATEKVRFPHNYSCKFQIFRWFRLRTLLQ